ncbi:hypothetical protein VCSRO42_1208 [Vibrio cholerae]|nr:hypothetical protein VCSRO42_1208 [Vibrio cholerae]
MKIKPFTRPTVVAAIEFLGQKLTQANFDMLIVRMGFDDQIPLGPSKSVSAKRALLAHILNRNPTVVIDTLNGSMTLAEAAVREAVRATVPDSACAEQLAFLRGLALDGYIVNWDEETIIPTLRAALPDEVDLPAADDEVHLLLKQFGFFVSLGHLDQAIEAHTRGDWAAANSQMRTFLEGLLNEIAQHIDPQKTAGLSSSENCRSLVAERGFLSVSRNEWTTDGKNFLNGLFKMLHTDGSPPGLSDEDHCTFRLHIALVTGRNLLRRLNNGQ